MIKILNIESKKETNIFERLKTKFNSCQNSVDKIITSFCEITSFDFNFNSDMNIFDCFVFIVESYGDNKIKDFMKYLKEDKRAYIIYYNKNIDEDILYNLKKVYSYDFISDIFVCNDNDFELFKIYGNIIFQFLNTKENITHYVDKLYHACRASSLVLCELSTFLPLFTIAASKFLLKPIETYYSEISKINKSIDKKIAYECLNSKFVFTSLSEKFGILIFVSEPSVTTDALFFNLKRAEAFFKKISNEDLIQH